MDDCCGVCCICMSCVAPISTAFRYVTFQTMSRERIRLSTSSFPVQTQIPTPRPAPARRLAPSAGLRHRCAHFHSIALPFSLPILAAMLAFVTYTETSKQFDRAVLFASFTLFQLLRQPTMFVPRTLSAIADARDALVRLSLVFCAPLHEGAPFVVDPDIALAFSLPVLAATFAFVTYTETSKQFDGAVLFASFSLFQARFSLASSRTLVTPSSYLYRSFRFCYSPSAPLPLADLHPPLLLLRQPIMFLPHILSTITDVRNALARLSLIFCTPLREGTPFVVDIEQEAAVWSKGVGCVYEEKEKEGGEKEKQNEEQHAHEADEHSRCTTSVSIPRSTLAAVVGRGGSGKSSLLQGLWAFGGSMVYFLQSAWIQNATLRDNVLFGQPFEEERYCGEKGINLSGGQKQRVNIARALYYGTDVVIFDDPLSAVDADVGKALFRSAIQGLVAQGKTVLLVTHALHFLAQCDYIYTLDGGRIAEARTYPELIACGGEFARLDREFGGPKVEDAGRERMGTETKCRCRWCR
ncbi:P-loop containing nucleoside triphosphate hydrolase protein [Mycena leptocephala]|nr:P-loop containing nucleoside triphosphate hydrolase protein [Mycena leptocephala]